MTFEQLYTTYFADVYRFSLWLSHDPSEAEDWIMSRIRTGGFDEGRLLKLAVSPGARDKIDRDRRLANSIGVRGTPTLFIDGHRAYATEQGIRAILELASSSRP